jgi:bifunctional non-homologous end joining protein LigD
VITHPEKVLFSADGITKGELAAYYERVAAVMVPHLAGRPVTMERYPAGIDRKGFIQKDVVKGFPEWLERVEVPKKGGTSHYALVNDARSLLWTVNQNSITPHVWTSRLPALDKPDLLVVDLDPEKGDLEPLLRAALLVRDLLAELGLESWVKTSGSKGFHIAVPLDGTASFETVWRFSHGLGAVLVKQNPDELTQEFIKADRGGRLFVDTGRNAYGATFAAPYAVRARPGASVSAPCTWQEIERGAVTPRSFTLRTLPARLAETGDLWLTLKGKAQSLDAALRDLEARLTESEWEESLAARTRRPTSRKKSPHETKRR